MIFVRVKVLVPVGEEYLCFIDSERVDENTVIAFEKDGKEYLLESAGDEPLSVKETFLR